MPWADEETFWSIYRNQSPQAATSWLREQTDAAGLLQSNDESSPLQWDYGSIWGPINLTVNTAKPEKDPRAIERAAHEAASSDAQSTCPFCWESANEVNHLRLPLTLGNEAWSLHYSPYAYFPEHCIVSTKDHRPMRITRQTFVDLLDLCDLFPHYFFGSNADLPLVGGSILGHHHYQGGCYVFPLGEAPLGEDFKMPEYPQVKARMVYWPLTVIRLESEHREALVNAATRVLAWWRSYSDPERGIIAVTPDGVEHNTIAPIARKRAYDYVLDLVLRCNITSKEHPLGVFHPHKEVHQVKKENIGLIEAMGMAILPPRVLEHFQVEDPQSPDRARVGELFVRGLEHCGVPLAAHQID